MRSQKFLARTLLDGTACQKTNGATMRAPRKARAKGVSAAQSGRDEFLLARLGKGCWVVGYQGQVIAGAVLSSLPAAAAYAADLAHAFGSHNFLLTVVEAGRHVV
jgi:hypothetical protein